MTENPEVPGEEARTGSTAPGLEGEGGQYVDGDYGDAGTVEVPAVNAEGGRYPDGDYGEAGTVEAPAVNPEGGQYPDGDYGTAGTAGAAGNAAESPEDAEYPDGDYGDAGTAGNARATDAIREGLTDRQVNTTAEERGPLHGRRDCDR